MCCTKTTNKATAMIRYIFSLLIFASAAQDLPCSGHAGGTVTAGGGR